MVAYTRIVKIMVMALCVLRSITAYAMDGRELIDPVSERRSSRWLFDGQSLSRHCPRWFGNNASIKRPLPTRASSVATVSSKYSKKQIAMFASMLVITGFTGYYIGNTCQMCVRELNEAQRYVNDLDDSFKTCTNTTAFLTMLVEDCVANLDSVKDLIIEHCSK